MKILLDTCTFLWIVSDAPELTEAGKTVFSDPDNDVYLSSVSAWEILVKYLLGKLSISGAPECFFIKEHCSQYGFFTVNNPFYSISFKLVDIIFKIQYFWLSVPLLPDHYDNRSFGLRSPSLKARNTG